MDLFSGTESARVLHRKSTLCGTINLKAQRSYQTRIKKKKRKFQSCSWKWVRWNSSLSVPRASACPFCSFDVFTSGFCFFCCCSYCFVCFVSLVESSSEVRRYGKSFRSLLLLEHSNWVAIGWWTGRASWVGGAKCSSVEQAFYLFCLGFITRIILADSSFLHTNRGVPRFSKCVGVCLFFNKGNGWFNLCGLCSLLVTVWV